MKKIKELIKHHKSLAIITGLSLLVLIIMIAIFLGTLTSQSKNKYGDRLEGIKEVKIDNSVYDEIENKLKETEAVSEVTTRLQGKIVYVEIVYNQDISLDKAKEYATSTLELFDSEQLSYYDICYFVSRLTDKDNKEDVSYHVTGTKHPKIDTISWIRS